MAHNTGFTSTSLGNALAHAGFVEVLVKRDKFDLWALALMHGADKEPIQQNLKRCGLDMSDEAGDSNLGPRRFGLRLHQWAAVI